jgi:hypothetical protein
VSGKVVDIFIHKEHAPQVLCTVVPWPQTRDGTHVKTNGYIEEALGLDAFICGWCAQGFYLRRDILPSRLVAYLDSIYWDRVQYVSSNFDIRPRGFVTITDTPVYFVTEHRYMRLMRSCFKRIKKEVHEHELELARKVGGKKTTIAGPLT